MEELLLRVYDTDGIYSKAIPRNIAVSNIDLKECDQSSSAHQDIGIYNLEVIKEIKQPTISLYNCKVEIVPEIGYCGDDGWYTYKYSGKDLDPYNIGLTKEECQLLVQRQEVTILLTYGTVTTNLTVKGNNRWAVTSKKTLIGTVKFDASCRGKTLVDHTGVKRENLIYGARVSTTALLYTGTYLKATNKIVVKGLIHFEATQSGQFEEPTLGTFFYNYTDIPSSECEFFRSVYRGKGNWFKSNRTNGLDLVRIRDNQQNSLMTFLLTNATLVCGRQGYATTEDNFYIIMYQDKPYRSEAKDIVAGDITDNDQIVNRFRTLHFDVNTLIEKDFWEISLKICESEKRQMTNYISILGNKFGEASGAINAYIVGTQILNQGAASYIIAGNEMNATVRRINECCEELPIFLNIKDGSKIEVYSDPRTSIIKPYCSPRACDDVFPYVYHVETYQSQNNPTKTLFLCTTNSPSISICQNSFDKLSVPNLRSKTHISESFKLRNTKPYLVDHETMQKHHQAMLMHGAKSSIEAATAKEFVRSSPIELPKVVGSPTIKSGFQGITSLIVEGIKSIFTGLISKILAGIASIVIAAVICLVVIKFSLWIVQRVSTLSTSTTREEDAREFKMHIQITSKLESIERNIELLNKEHLKYKAVHQNILKKLNDTIAKIDRISPGLN